MKALSNPNAIPQKGRGASDNPQNRFESLAYEEVSEDLFVTADSSDDIEDSPSLKTRYYWDHSKSILSKNDSPDVGFNFSLNPYRGCEHGCIYCYARPTHEYLGLSAGLDFESKILVKKSAPQLLRRELLKKTWQPQVVVMSGVTDCYQPAEKIFQLTRQCLEVFAEFKNPVTIITKNRLVTRDQDVLQNLAEFQGVRVMISITTLDSHLARILEPRTSMPDDRLRAIETLATAGVPVGVMASPLIPAINDVELPAILKAARNAGATRAGWILVRLPYGVKHLFTRWLEQHFPERKQKVLHRLQSARGGKLNQAQFGQRMRGQGVFAQQLEQVFQLTCRRLGLNQDTDSLSTEHFQRPVHGQLGLF